MPSFGAGQSVGVAAFGAGLPRKLDSGCAVMPAWIALTFSRSAASNSWVRNTREDFRLAGNDGPDAFWFLALPARSSDEEISAIIPKSSRSQVGKVVGIEID